MNSSREIVGVGFSAYVIKCLYLMLGLETIVTLIKILLFFSTLVN